MPLLIVFHCVTGWLTDNVIISWVMGPKKPLFLMNYAGENNLFCPVTQQAVSWKSRGINCTGSHIVVAKSHRSQHSDLFLLLVDLPCPSCCEEYFCLISIYKLTWKMINLSRSPKTKKSPLENPAYALKISAVFVSSVFKSHFMIDFPFTFPGITHT